MAYNLYSENGFVGQIATITGMQELDEFVQVNPYLPALKELVSNGETQRVTELKDDCQKALRAASISPAVRQTVQELSQMLQKVNEIAIVSV